MIIFKGNDRYAYRDPACIFNDGVCHLFFTVSEKDGGYMYNRIAHSESRDLLSWTEPVILTEKNAALNYCSPGNIIEHDGRYIMCFCSYPMPYPFAENFCADESARLFTMETEDFITYTEPKLLNPKSGTPCEDIGRMIDPYILERDGVYTLFFKQNGISMSISRDLEEWSYVGYTEGGENACVIEHEDKYLLIHSPKNGIAVMSSDDLSGWSEYSYTTLLQDEWKWAEGRLTAAFAARLPDGYAHKYVVFFHGSENIFPETHGNATLAMAFTDDFIDFIYDI